MICCNESALIRSILEKRKNRMIQHRNKAYNMHWFKAYIHECSFKKYIYCFMKELVVSLSACLNSYYLINSFFKIQILITSWNVRLLFTLTLKGSREPCGRMRIYFLLTLQLMFIHLTCHWYFLSIVKDIFTFDMWLILK